MGTARTTWARASAALILLAACSSGDNRQGTSAWSPEDTATSGGVVDGTAGDGGGDLTDSGADTSGADGGAESTCEAGEIESCLCADGLHLGTRTCDVGGAWEACGPCDGGDDTGGEDTGDESSGGEELPEEVCYLGASSDYTTCLALHYFEPDAMPEGYAYPGLFEDDPNYRSPIAFIDLEENAPDTSLAPNFVLSEFAELAQGRWAVVQPHAVESMQTLRDTYGAITVFSAFRSPSYNAEIDGVTWSRHMYGDGFDFALSGGGIEALEAGCEDEGGVLVEYASHVHCDFRLDPVDEAFFGPE